MGGQHMWRVATDAGRPEGRACPHLGLLEDLGPAPAASPVACAGCLARGLPWVRLRQCVTCGYVGCCDSSRGRHAYGHHVESGHPVAVSLAADEDWAWCFPDEVFLVRAGTRRPGAPTTEQRPPRREAP